MGAQDPRPGQHLTVGDTAEAIAFYTDVFAAVPLARECLLDGRVLRAELAVAGHHLTVSEWHEAPPPAATLPDPAALAVVPADPHLLLQRALAAGAVLEPAAGDPPRVVFRDPAGQRWEVVGAPATAQ
ncbi:VOC family protein [Micromonospora okii]|uniref:VOC family protein n=1 Tax=Micromonospora okii TaxID=1182970 RepID=UPI001E51C7E9|nr:VOC family protein [Micromonospora okii]